MDFQTIDVGTRLHELRTERGLSMRSLPRLSGLSTTALSMIERSRTSPSVSTLYKIADALGVRSRKSAAAFSSSAVAQSTIPGTEPPAV